MYFYASLVYFTLRKIEYISLRSISKVILSKFNNVVKHRIVKCRIQTIRKRFRALLQHLHSEIAQLRFKKKNEFDHYPTGVPKSRFARE